MAASLSSNFNSTLQDYVNDTTSERYTETEEGFKWLYNYN